MEVPDVNVRVLYDFEYSTKDGRQIKITGGERLFLIAKTNSDWWHVIRSSERRPFYVPATYVQEIKKGGGQGQKREAEGERSSDRPKGDPKVGKEESPSTDSGVDSGKEPKSLIQVRNEPPIGFNMGYRNRSCSLEDKKMYSVKLSSFDRQRILKGRMFASPTSSQFETHPETLEEQAANKSFEVDYVNLRKGDDGEAFVIDEDTVPETSKSAAEHSSSVEMAADSDQLLQLTGEPAAKRESGSEISPLEHGGYSYVSNFSKNAIDTRSVNEDQTADLLAVSHHLPHSNSLEELTLEIQLKTNSLRSNMSGVTSKDGTTGDTSPTLGNDKDKLPSTSDNSVESNIDSAFDSSESMKEVTRIKVDDHELIGSPVPLQRKLRYVGSFKTKQEREKWARQHTEVQESEVGSGWGSGESRPKPSGIGVVCMKSEYESKIANNRIEEKLLQSADCNSISEVIEGDTNNVLSIMVNCDDSSPSPVLGVSSSFIESSRKTEEHLQQIQQNLGIAQEASTKIEKYVSPKQTLRSFNLASDGNGAANKPRQVESIDLLHDDNKDTKKNVARLTVEPKTPSSLKDSTESIRCANSTNSERGSTDSLLDIDRNSNGRKVSCGTTTSESLIPTDGEDVDEEGNSDSETDSVVLGLSRMEQVKRSHGNAQKRKTSLIRNRRVESCKARSYLHQAPPSPTPSQAPTKALPGSWNEYTTSDGRVFFYNTETGERSWKPPRRRFNANEDKKGGGKEGNLTNVYSGSSSPLAEVDEKVFQSSLENLPLPAGWKTKLDDETGLPCYLNVVTGAKWFSSSDYEGRVYFFEENSNESSWTLPETSYVTNINENVSSVSTQPSDVTGERNYNRVAKTRSMIFDDRKEDVTLPPAKPKNWPQLWDGHMCVLLEGTLNRTKITENGKRLRKNWASSYVVLTELFLLFFKDQKSFLAMKNGTGRPEMCVDLNGAVIDRGDKVSSRKNVFVISTVLALQVLIQCDCQGQADQWLQCVQSAINNLPSTVDKCIRVPRGPKEGVKQEELEEGKKVSRIGRSKSVKLKKEGSIEDLSLSSAESKTKIKARLKKFFHRRPTVEALEKKGIYKDEQVFGCFLENVCGTEYPRVPLFVQRCIRCIERTEENMKTDGLYRASGNLSQVQKIRLQVDQNNWSCLEQEEDVHVLTGALKLFFRELKAPLIPAQHFSKALKASTHPVRKEKIAQFREIVKNLPIMNCDTLRFLLQHLRRVTEHQESNRMHIPNLAIVFGPTLMRPEQESLNMAFDLMQQNLVIECLLVEFENIFR